MKRLLFQISIFLLLIPILSSCEKEYDTNIDPVWSRGMIKDGGALEFLNKEIIVVCNNGRIEGAENRMTTFTDLGRQQTENVDLNNIIIEQEGESFCIPQLAHLYFVHQAWESSSKIQNHCGFFLVTEFLSNQEGVIILSSEYTPSSWEWTGR